MSAFKKLNRKDVFTTVYNAHKQWYVTGSGVDTYQIKYKTGTTGSFPSYSGSVDYTNLINYRSLRHLYYTNFVSESLNGSVPTGSFENYLQGYTTSGSRQLGNEVKFFSIPRDLYGVSIKKGTFRSLINTEYILNEDDYVDESVSEYILGGDNVTVYDDSFGNLRTSNEVLTLPPNTIVGDIIYSHGLAIFTNKAVSDYYGTNTPSLSWQGTRPILTSNIICKVKDYEFNFSQNPTTTTGNDGTLKANVTGSDFRPYITTIGLYNDSNELLAVGKMGRPIPKSKHTDMTFEIKIDI